MSVALEGTVTTSENSFIWKGTWQFLKEKKTSLNFSYERKDDKIPKDLFDYVSFLNEAPVPISHKKSKSTSKTKSRGRPLIPIIPFPSGSLATEADAPTIDSITNAEAAVEDAITSSNESLIIKDEPSVLVSDIPPEFIAITHHHPLMGLWEGSFNVKSANGGEEPVAETLFFYSILGSELPLELSDLPPEPHFPYGLLRKDSNTPTKAPINPQAVANVLAEATNNAAPSELIIPDAMSEELPTVSNVSSGNTVPELSSDPSKLTPKKNLVSAYTSNCDVLVGFGRNIFGRFSVAALYDESKGELRCEKKYLVSKFAAKRGRKSFAETSTNAAYDDVEGVIGEIDIDSSRPQSTRHRISNITYSDFLDDENTGLKRKRHSIGSVVGGGYGSKLKFDINGTLIDVKKESTHYGSGGVNALIGARNPDNDDPNAEYREAFQDCDTGEIYEGGWAYGMRYGRGVCLYADGLLFEGNWLQNKEHGKGQLMTADRQLIYSGDWLDGCFHGYGTYYFSNGDRYIGDWRESNRQGKGDYLFKNGCRYSGDWKDNKRHGKGVFVWPDESFYDGDWENERRHGRGVLELSNGFKYDGQWMNNLMEGKGNCTFPSGQQYQGTYKNGLREGRGSVIFAEGAVYEGRFREDRFDGQGTIKITENVPGFEDGELMIPIQIQSELWRIHLKAGFGQDAH